MVKSTTLDVTIGAVFIVFIIIGAICCCLSFIGGLVAIIMCNKNKSNQQPVQVTAIVMIFVCHRKDDQPVIVNANGPAPAPSPVVIHKAAPKKKKGKTTTSTGGTTGKSGMSTAASTVKPAKTGDDDEDPGLGA
ncbi:hypothetical protein GCK72_008812 [Caenorhabditis remanei]|uniref:Uncharacterized protein n=1 Tax=Caenorhabditis remanei TaxID=31234 RepID=A0A6A5H1V3_CAERE|nr:hypothetical protein GCK72_008812 [Caenorhabditis remanei]KAF1760563.1 hypothetical protein GCK72_008812 [Caenorhabditis remanei]